MRNWVWCVGRCSTRKNFVKLHKNTIFLKADNCRNYFYPFNNLSLSGICAISQQIFFLEIPGFVLTKPFLDWDWVNYSWVGRVWQVTSWLGMGIPLNLFLQCKQYKKLLDFDAQICVFYTLKRRLSNLFQRSFAFIVKTPTVQPFECEIFGP